MNAAQTKPTPPPAGLPRGVERLLAAWGLTATAPLLLAAWLLIRWTSPGPGLFRQTRIGLDGEPFTLLKLRSMYLPAATPPGDRGAGTGTESVTIAGDARITPIGRWLRRGKLDELPQLWNVLRGDLSFVGPRPEVPRYVDRDHPAWREVLAVRPGLTDPVTLRLRDEEALLRALTRHEGTSVDEAYRTLLPWKLAGYRRAIARRSPFGDLRVLAHTAWAIVRPPAPPRIDEILAARDAAPGLATGLGTETGSPTETGSLTETGPVTQTAPGAAR